MTKFKVGDKVKFNKENKEITEGYNYKIDKAYEVIEIFARTGTIVTINEDGRRFTFDEERFELVESKPTKNQRITALEEKSTKQDEAIEELKLIVHQLREANITIEDVIKHFAKPSTVDEDTIEFEGKPYKKVDRLAREGDVVITKEPAEETAYVKNNTPYKVVRGHDDKPYLIDSNVVYLYERLFGRTAETVDVYELIYGGVE